MLQELQGEGVSAEGLLYPPPASRFGVRDSGPSRTADLSFGTRDASCPLNGLHPKHNSPYFARFDREGHVSRRESRQPRWLALEEEEICEDRAGSHRLDYKAGSLYTSATSVYDEPTVADNGRVKMEDDGLMEQAQESCGYMEDGGRVAETLGARPQTDSLLWPRRPPSWEPEHGPRLVNGREPGWVRYLPSVAADILSGEELNQGTSSIADGRSTPSLLSLFAYAFPDDERHQRWLPESTRASMRSDGGGGTRSTCSGVAGTDWSPPHNPSSLPPLPLGDCAGATTKDNNPLVGITVRRPPSPHFSFMGEDCSPDASASPAASPKHQPPENAQQREVQGTSCMNGVDAWMRGADQHKNDSAQSRRPLGIPFEDNTDIPTASTPIMDEAGLLLSADAGRMTGEEVRIPALSKKRRHPAPREAVAPREPHSPSTGRYDAGFPSEDGAWLGSSRRLSHRRNGWWGAKFGYMPPSGRDQTAVGASRFLRVDDVPCGKRGQASLVTGAGRYEIGTAEADARRGSDVSKLGTGRNDTAAAVAGDGEIYHAEGDGRRGRGDKNAALAYDQDVLGGDGVAEAGTEDFEPETVTGVLGKLRCDENRNVLRNVLLRYWLVQGEKPKKKKGTRFMYAHTYRYTIIAVPHTGVVCRASFSGVSYLSLIRITGEYAFDTTVVLA